MFQNMIEALHLWENDLCCQLGEQKHPIQTGHWQQSHNFYFMKDSSAQFPDGYY